MYGGVGGGSAESPWRIATAPVNWNNDDLTGWRPPVPFPDILDRMHDAGYCATELGGTFPTRVEALSSAMSRRDMSLCGAYQWLPLRDPDRLSAALHALEPRLALLQGCGCHDLIIADALTPERVALAGHVPADGSASLDSIGFERIAGGTARAAAAAHQYGISVHYHNHVGTYVETPFEVDQLLPRLDHAGVDLCFDTGHYAYGGGDPVGFVATNAARIGYLHLKDVDGSVLAAARANQWSFLDALRHIVFAPLGQGIVDIAGIVHSLEAQSYDGWIVIEQDTCAGDSTDTARQNLDYLQAIIERPERRTETRMRGNQ